MGSNSELPIVGGSILTHEHFQGGSPEMPMFDAGIKKHLKAKYDKKVDIGILDWFTSVVLIKSSSKKLILEYASKITEKWFNYSNPELDIIAYTGDERHNTVTPIVRKVKSKYYLYLILRNNRTNEQYPDGIFHAHPEYHNIKKEGIGLIEQMGTFILPARLKRQLGMIEKALTTKTDFETLLAKSPDLKIHETLYRDLESLESEKPIQYDKEIRNYVSNVCREVLLNTSVFKDDEKGQTAFYDFLKSIKY
jgi:UDPglucose--hexose-1-phosphate uridylyltransferase